MINPPLTAELKIGKIEETKETARKEKIRGFLSAQIIRLSRNEFSNISLNPFMLNFSFFSVSILLHNLGRDVFGVYIFLISFIPLSAVFDFGISNAVVRKFSLPQTTREDKVKTWQTSFAIFTALALILLASVSVLLLYLTRTMPIFSHLDQNTVNWSILILSIIVFINHLNSHFLTLPQAEQRFDIFNSKTLLVGTANTIVSAVASGIYPNIAVIFGIQLLFHVFTLIYMVFYGHKFFSGRSFFPYFDRSTGKEIFSFGLKNFIGTLAGQVENQFSNFLLGAMVSAGAITAFSIPQSIVAKGAGVVSQFAQVFFPLSSSLLNKDRILKLKSLVIGLQGLIWGTKTPGLQWLG